MFTRVRLCISLFLVIVFLSCVSANGTIKYGGDRFSDGVVLELDGVGVAAYNSSNLGYLAGVTPPWVRLGGIAVSNDTASLSFTSSGETWRYLKCHHVSMLVDGKKIGFDDSEHDGDVLNYGVIEHIRVSLSPSNVDALMGARTVAFKICIDEFELNDKQVESVRKFAHGVAIFPKRIRYRDGADMQ